MIPGGHLLGDELRADELPVGREGGGGAEVTISCDATFWHQAAAQLADLKNAIALVEHPFLENG